MGRPGVSAPDFADAAALRAHYRAVETRLRRAATEPRPSARALAEARREGLARAAEEARLQAALAERAALDALVFQVFDPERLAREPKRIVARVAEAFGVPYADVIGPGTRRTVVRARWAAIAAIRAAWPRMSSPRIGRALGGRDHTTILHALKRMAEHGVPQPPDRPAP